MTQTSASNRKDVRAAEKQAEIDDRNRGNILQRIMSDGPGRRWIWDLLAATQIYDGGHYPDSNLLHFRQGQRSVGLTILSDILRFCPELYITAQREANGRSTTADQLATNASDARAEDGGYAAELAADLDAAARSAEEYRHPAEV